MKDSANYPYGAHVSMLGGELFQGTY
jgi:hypothetical protein